MASPAVAMVFAAGLGTRMRPITDTLPKPLVRVGGRSMLDGMLDRLADAGVARAVVNVHHLADLIEASLAGRTRPEIVISDERDRLLDQGGGIVQARTALGREPIFICNTDAVWVGGPGDDLARMAAAWDPARMDVLLLVAERRRSVGVDWVYAGVGIIKLELFDGIAEPVFRLAPYFFRAAEQGRLFGARLDATWLHVGTPAAIDEAEAAFAAAGSDQPAARR